MAAANPAPAVGAPRQRPVAGIECLHDGVPGRLRLRVPGLCGAPGLRAPLERDLRVRGFVRSVAADPRSGNLLVVHDPATRREDVLAAVADVLGAATGLCIEPGERLAPQVTPTRDAEATGSATGGRPATAEGPAWHALGIREVLRRRRGTLRGGLTEHEAAARLERHGPNALPVAPEPTPAELVWRQVGTLPVGLLAGSALLSVATGGLADALAIAAVVGINTGIGYFTEREADKIIRSLSTGAPPRVPVIRGGRERPVPVAEVVPGDLLVLSPGTWIAADARVVEEDRLSVDESALTGESLPINKNAALVLEAATPLGDRVNLVHRGTLVTGGSGRAIVVGTGLDTEIGRIQQVASAVETPNTPIERQLESVGRQLAIASVAACAGVFGIGALRGLGLLELLRTSISLGVAAVPEGLPTVATSTLALGVRRMRGSHVLVRRMQAIETLGSMQVLCLDKTGTLTRNRLAVAAIELPDGSLELHDGRLQRDGRASDAGACCMPLLETLALCNDSMVLVDDGGRRTLDGSGTENALLEVAMALGVDVDGLRERFPRQATEYRSEDRLYMVTLHRAGKGRRRAAVKGSPAQVLEKCERVLLDGQAVPLTDALRLDIRDANDRLAGRAMRVLGVARADAGPRQRLDRAGLTWLGLVGMEDPLRPEARGLIGELHRAGIDTVMITGDQASTAQAIGRELALAGTGPLKVLEAQDLGRLDPQVLEGLARQTHVFARVTPTHKLEVVQALQRSGRIVAMTGDGVNDGPALRAANIGVAMGGGAQDVARSVADIVLERDDLATLLEAVAEGRTIYANVRKAIRYLLATNFSELEVMMGSLALGLPVPLNPMQLLWVNLITDVFPAIALALEPREPDVMRQPPRDPARPILGREDLGTLGRQSLVISAGTMAAYGYGLLRYGPGPRASSLAFGSLTLAQLLHAYGTRSERNSVLARGSLPPNRRLDLAVGASAIAQLGTLFTPFGWRLLGTALPGPVDLAVMLAGAGGPFLVNEWLKLHDREAATADAESEQEKPA